MRVLNIDCKEMIKMMIMKIKDIIFNQKEIYIFFIKSILTNLNSY